MPDYILMLNTLYSRFKLKSVLLQNQVFTFHYGSEWVNYISLVEGIQREYNKKFPYEYHFIVTEQQLEQIEKGEMSGKEIANLIRGYGSEFI